MGVRAGLSGVSGDQSSYAVIQRRGDDVHEQHELVLPNRGGPSGTKTLAHKQVQLFGAPVRRSSQQQVPQSSSARLHTQRTELVRSDCSKILLRAKKRCAPHRTALAARPHGFCVDQRGISG